MDPFINLIVKVQEFEDKRIAAKASWNIRELKGKLSEIYPTSTEEQKLIYSGKLLSDTVVLKDVLREYEGQEAHTVHLVFTPKTPITPSSTPSSSSTSQQSKNSPISTRTSPEMSGSELRQRHTAAAAATTTTTPATTSENQPTTTTTNIPNDYYNAFYAGTTAGSANNILAQQYAMQTWMQQAYAQYVNQYMNIMSSPEAFRQQQQQQAQSMPTFPFMQPPQMPFMSPTVGVSAAMSSSQPATDSTPSPQAPAPQPPQQQPAAAAAAERRFPNIIQDEPENRDWLDNIYSMSRLLILLCLVYFYSSPLRCCIVILIGVSIYLYHIYRRNQTRLNNNNTTRVNLNVNRPAPAAPAVENQNENGEEPIVAEENSNLTEATQNNNEEPHVPLLDVVQTFLVSFVASLIPSDPAI